MAEPLQLLDGTGRRKYLTPEERERFLDAASRLKNRNHRTFALTLAHLGCRISEALEITPQRIDLSAGHIVIRSLKKRGKTHHRAIPAPPALLEALELVYGLRSLPVRSAARSEPLWPYTRRHGHRIIKRVLSEIDIDPTLPAATAKGLRHAYAVHALMKNVPLTLVRTWLGHASLETTAIYLEVLGTEQRSMAEKMWEGA